MKVAVYALIRDDGRRVSARGISGERLRVARVGALAAVVGDVARPPAPTEAKLRAYMSVVAALATRHRAILPVRFGTIMEDDAKLETVLRARQQAIRSQLAHVRGRAQMTVRVVAGRTLLPVGRTLSGPPREPDKARATTGTQYLTTRTREQRASNIPGFAPLSHAVARWVRDQRVDRRGNIATVYHLIPRAAAARYASAIENAAAAEGVRVVVSGPWPAHAFADRW